jgi:hypothetical protein
MKANIISHTYNGQPHKIQTMSHHEDQLITFLNSQQLTPVSAVCPSDVNLEELTLLTAFTSISMQSSSMPNSKKL